MMGVLGRRTKGRKRAISALRNNAGVSITSTKGKLRIFQSHYQDLGSKSVDDAFDEDWKQEVESRCYAIFTTLYFCYSNSQGKSSYEACQHLKYRGSLQTYKCC